jgi:hypothetical protein
MSNASDKQLSDDFRAFFSSLSSFSRNEVQRAMLEAFDTGSIRNVKLWTEPGVQTRSFIHNRLAPKERRKRELFARSVLAGSTTNRSTKTATFSSGSVTERKRFAGWMNDPFTLGYRNGYFPAILSISIDSSGGILMVYDSYPDPNPDEPSTASPDDAEFEDVGI